MTYVQSGTYAPGEVPKYAFCEVSCAGPRSKWHIRKIKDRLWLTGGIDTQSLCGYVKPLGPELRSIGGWDLNIKINDRHLGRACPDCVKRYREEAEPCNGT